MFLEMQYHSSHFLKGRLTGLSPIYNSQSWVSFQDLLNKNLKKKKTRLRIFRIADVSYSPGVTKSKHQLINLKYLLVALQVQVRLTPSNYRGLQGTQPCLYNCTLVPPTISISSKSNLVLRKWKFIQYMHKVQLYIGSSGRDRKANEDGHFHLRGSEKNQQD